MQLSDRGGQLVSRPAPNPTIAPGWGNNDLTQTTPPTIGDPDWMNAVSAEFLSLLTFVGLAFSKASVNQLLSAVARLAGGNVTPIASTPGSPLTADNAGLVLVDATAGNISITLPASAAAGGAPLPFDFVRTDATSNTVSVALNAGDTTLPAGSSGPLALGPQSQLTLRGDGVSHWVQEGLNSQRPFYDASTSLSTTTGDNTNYTLLAQAVTLPTAARTGGFRLRIRGVLVGTSAGTMNQNFQLQVSDGTTTQAGAWWLNTTISSETVGVEGGFLFPTIYAAGATLTITLSVNTGGGGSYPSVGLVMSAANLQIAVEDA